MYVLIYLLLLCSNVLCAGISGSAYAMLYTVVMLCSVEYHVYMHIGWLSGIAALQSKGSYYTAICVHTSWHVLAVHLLAIMIAVTIYSLYYMLYEDQGGPLRLSLGNTLI